MKVKNDYIIIKSGDNTYEFKNLILNDYLQRFVKKQLADGPYGMHSRTDIGYIFLKFDTPLIFNTGSTLYDNDFDISIIGKNSREQTASTNQISIQFNFTVKEDDRYADFSDFTVKQGLSDFYDRKITAIGFSSYWSRTGPYGTPLKIMAVLDTNNFNIKLQEKQDFSVTRKDTISTDANFYSSDLSKVICPVHLAPLGIEAILPQSEGPLERAHGKLYSIGLSNRIDTIEADEFEVDAEEGRFLVETDTGLEIKGLSRDEGLYPSEDLLPDEDLYPDDFGYKYVVLKYKVMQMVYNGDVGTYTDTGKYYLQSFEADDYDYIKAIINYERG